VGEAVRSWRGGRIVVSTKNPCYDNDEKAWWGHLETSLERLGTGCIDIYNHHGLGWQRYSEFAGPHAFKWMQRAKDQGLIRHISFSFHDNNEALRKLTDLGCYDVVTLQYNMLDRSLEDGIAHAHESGMGVVVMGPVGGGRLGSDSEVLAKLHPQVRRVPELALRWVLSNPNVTVALSGMGNEQMVEENVRVCSDPTALSPDDHAAIEEHLLRLRKMADLYCTACGYCKPCAAGVDIPRIFELHNRGRVYGIWENARAEYRGMPTAAWFASPHATACTRCGECEDRCPQKIAIRDQLEQAHEALMKDAEPAG
jgi:predicted aldo/keto reductase-like oxidoreductase